MKNRENCFAHSEEPEKKAWISPEIYSLPVKAELDVGLDVVGQGTS